MFNLVRRRCQDSTDSEDVTTRVNYCSKDDVVCQNCVVSSSKPVCYGTNSQCICQSFCSSSTVRPASSCVTDIPVASVWLTFGGFALLMPILLYMHRKWNEPHGAQHMIYNRRRRRLQRKKDAQRDTTRDLTLSGWRSHCEQFKLDMDNIELKTCYLQLHDLKTSDGVAVNERSEGSGTGAVSSLSSPIGCEFSWNAAARVVSLPPAAVVPQESPSSSYPRHNPVEHTEELSAVNSEYEEIVLDVGSHARPDDREHDSAQAA
uniref:Uncharacterized protein n=1 Tax=Globisporangium ultimum (strain ATCC 200006 / CBS 805.95 / DAOM BR144) TaxID=431595 RepID=K3WQ15_GLOUD